MWFLPFEVPIALSPTERQTHRVHRSETAHLHRVASQSPRDSLAILHRGSKWLQARKMSCRKCHAGFDSNRDCVRGRHNTCCNAVMSMREFGRADEHSGVFYGQHSTLLDTTSTRGQKTYNKRKGRKKAISQVETAPWPARRRKQRNCWQGESGLDDPERLTLTLLHKPLPIHNLQGPRKINTPRGDSKGHSLHQTHHDLNKRRRHQIPIPFHPTPASSASPSSGI
jgi:hypothetical protein